MSTTTVRDGMTVISFTTKETAAQMRKALKAAFPATTFSVRMARGTGYGWFDVTWTDGPTTTQVQQVTDRFRDQRWDGMSDCYAPVEASLYAIEGEELPVLVEFSCSGANGSRRFSTEAQAWAEATVRATWPTVDSAGWATCPVVLPGHVVLTHPHGDVAGHAYEFLNRLGDLTGRQF